MSAQNEIKILLNEYEQALNASDVAAAVALYTEDGIFMPTEAPTAAGSAQLTGAYQQVFDTIQLNIKFQVDEVDVQGDLAFARTVSRGEVTILAADITQPEENRELFVFRKTDGVWKIARYMFNKSAPAAAN